MDQPEHLNKYLIDSVLGRGAMGVVYKARDPHMDRTVAIKTLRPDLLDAAERETWKARFRSEARAYGRLLHPNIVTCYSYEEDGDEAFIVMEFVEGTTLSHLLDSRTPIPVERAVAIMNQLLDALAYAHDHGVIHRDIKPANVILTAQDRVKVTDFGIARVDSTTLTQTGYAVGSPSYMSPEQFTGEEVDARADLFSAGILLYQMLTGIKPFTGLDLGQILHSILYSDPVPPSRHNPRLTTVFDRVVAKALARPPDERYESAGKFVTAIKAAYLLHLRTGPESWDGDGDRTQLVDAEPAATTASSATVGAASPPPASPVRAALKPSKRLIIGTAAAVGFVAASAIALNLSSQSGSSQTAASGTAPPALPQNTGTQTAATTLASGAIGADHDLARFESPEPAAPDLLPIQAFAASLDCAQVSADADRGTVTLAGHVASDKDKASLLTMAAETPGVLSVKQELRVRPPELCRTTRLLESLADDMPLLDASEAVRRLRAGDYVTLDLAAPDFPSYLYVDYFLADGTVLHMAPNPVRTDNRATPGDTWRLGEPEGPGRQWQVAPPFGEEIISVIATDQPLFDQPRPETEDAAAYLKALEEAVANRAPLRIAADHQTIHTGP